MRKDNISKPIKINFDVAHNPEEPTLVLAKKNGDKLGKINAKSIEVSDNMNDSSEITFNVYKYLDGKKDPLWDLITNFKLVYCIEWDCYFEATVEIDESNETKKTVFCTQLGHAELGQIMLYNIAINTDGEDGDIARDDYLIPTVLYRKDEYDISENDKKFYKEVFKKNLDIPFSDYKSASLLHRILKDKAPHYSIKHVDESIARMQRVFEFDDTSICDALQEIAEEINCIFVFGAGFDDNGIFMRTISVYDLESNCKSCGHRGEFSDKCPKCESTNIDDGYGEDTSIFVTADEIANDIQFTAEVDEIKNCFKLEAGDELMTATIRSCNPNGSDYIWYLSDEMKADMSDDLVGKINEYDKLYDYYQNAKIEINSSLSSEYNKIVDKYNFLMNIPEDEMFEKIPSSLNGFSDLINALYNTFDMHLYLESGLMPTIDVARPDINQEIAKLTSDNIPPVAVNVTSTSSNPLKSAQVYTVDNIVLSMAKAMIDSRYKIKIADGSTLSEYEDGVSYRTWEGKFILTAYSDDEITETTDIIKIEVNDDYETYIKRKLEKTLSSEDVEDMSISGLFKKNLVKDLIESTPVLVDEVFDGNGNRKYEYEVDVVSKLPSSADIGYMCEYDGDIYVWCESEYKEGESEEDSFEYALKEYSLNRLKSFSNACESCLEIMQEMGVTKGETWGKDLYDRLYLPYYNKLSAINAEIDIRGSEIAVIKGMYNADGEMTSIGLEKELEDKISKIQDALNFEKYLGDLWFEFCSFRREDKYSNDNYISEGKNNSEIISMANEFIDVANKEVRKSAELQCSISADLKNILAIKKFEPLVDKFRVGNWLRVMVDDKVYKLRLISYSIDYDDLNGISVEFADAVKSNSSVKSVQSVLAQASSMATSYSSVQRQASQGKKSNDVINDWVDSGLDATNVKIMGGANGQSQTWDSHGMLFREYDESIGDYSPEQMKIINSTMAITTDNWETTKTAVGKYCHKDKDGNVKVAYGINAETIVGKFILGENMTISNKSGSMVFDDDGLSIEQGQDNVFTIGDNGLIASNDKHEVSINPSGKSIISIEKIAKNANDENESVFSVDASGNLKIVGDVTANSLKLGDGVRINASKNIENLSLVALDGSYKNLVGDANESGKVLSLDNKGGVEAASLTYEDLTNHSELAKVSDLSDVATSGSYNDLIDKPSVATSVTSNGTKSVSGKAVYDYAVAKNQGVSNAGKLLYVNNDGSVTTLSIEGLKELLKE